MANGPVHDGVNLFLGGLLAGTLWGMGIPLGAIIALILGVGFSTFIFPPDTDLRPRKRLSFLRFFFYPYAFLFKHRGLSHGFLTGFCSRILYLIFLMVLCGWLADPGGQWGRMEGWEAGKKFLAILWNWPKDFHYLKWPYDYIIWGLIGMYVGDLSHILLDRILSRILRFFS